MLKQKVTNVTLKRFEYDDANEYFLISKDKKVKSFFRLAYCETIEEAEELMELYIESYNYIALKILDSSSKIVGVILGEKKAKGVLEVSYFIREEDRKKGYCQSAILQFEQYILKNTKYKILEFCIDLENKKSHNVMKALKIQKDFERRFAHYKKRLPV